MTQFLTVSGAVLRKDCRELWPQAAPTAALIALASAVGGRTGLNAVLQLAALFLMAVLVTRLMQSDSPVSVQHDWLTRPMPWMTLLAAKGAFMILWITLPDAVGATVKGLISGYSLGEALPEGVQQSAPSPVLLGVVVVAVITASIWQAMVTLMGTVVALGTVLAGVERQGGSRGTTFDPFTGTFWVMEWSVGLLVIVGGALILWSQYGRRNTVEARTMYAGLVVLSLAVAILMSSTARRFALQKQLRSDPVAAAQVVVELTPGCFASKLVRSGNSSVSAVSLESGFVVPDALAGAAGLDALAFSTVLAERKPARDGHVIVGSPTARYVDVAGRTLFTIGEFGFTASPKMSTTTDGRTAVIHDWLLPRERYEQLAARSDVRLQIDYFLTLLVPKTQAVVPTDGRREFYSDLGYCGVRPPQSSKSAAVDCFKAGPQPALLLVNEVGGTPGSGRSLGVADFTPSMLSLFSGRRYEIAIEPSDGQHSQLQITAYEARAHFERRITAPGILGGTKEMCPVPTGVGTPVVR